MGVLVIVDPPTRNRGMMHSQVYMQECLPNTVWYVTFSRQTTVPDGVVCALHSLLRSPAMVESGLQILPTFPVLHYCFLLLSATSSTISSLWSLHYLDRFVASAFAQKMLQHPSGVLQVDNHCCLRMFLGISLGSVSLQPIQ